MTDNEDNSWTLPPIDDEELEEDLLSDEAKSKGLEQKEKEVKEEKKPKETFIESISIREYLIKLKEREKIISSPVT